MRIRFPICCCWTYGCPAWMALRCSPTRGCPTQLLAWIRGHPEFKTLQVFVWTDSGDRETLDRAAKAGANRFVPKSVAFVRGGLAGLVRAIGEAIPASLEKASLSVKSA